MTHSNLFGINFLNIEHAGYYECTVKTKYGIAKETFKLDIKKKLLNNNNKESISNNKINFKFLEKDIRPNGRIHVICDSGT